MRQIEVKEIIEAVAQLCIEANYNLGEDVLGALKSAINFETSLLGKEALEHRIETARIAREEKTPICQDTGVAVVFLELGQEAHIVGGDLYEAINEGVRKGYKEGYLRASMVSDPFLRHNTGDNTPAVIYTDVVPGDKLKITVMPKGCGSENMSALKMLRPADGMEGAEKFVVETVESAGANPCPPIIVGVGIGGTFEFAPLLAKRALLRPIGTSHAEEHIAELEKELLKKINALVIGPQGFGGCVTALAVCIETFPCHIASLPVAVNINCHASRHREVIL